MTKVQELAILRLIHLYWTDDRLRRRTKDLSVAARDEVYIALAEIEKAIENLESQAK